MIVPVRGARVLKANGDKPRLGVVKRAMDSGSPPRVEVEWRPDRQVSVEFVHTLRTALRPGAEVLHSPPESTRKRLGHGRVEQVRTLGGREQVLVDFWEESTRLWLPWEHLLPVPSVAERVQLQQTPEVADAEVFRMRNLAYALDQWHSNTGALSRLEIDPLPHQIHLVHRILTSGELNWLIADDVGLGKTIEVGLLLAALRRRGLKRFLLVVPAGLTRQWKEEMRDKFDIRDFMIYGDDFVVDDPVQWKLFDRVIASVDRLKREEHERNIVQAEPWDMVVFDEAHWLSRHEYGYKMDASDRYRLARRMRDRTENVLLLTGTPHQGKDDKFRGLLELLRPGKEWQERFQRLRTEPEMLRDIVIRNRKADVTDLEGNFIFRGKDTHTISVQLEEEERQFDEALSRYIREGYQAGERSGYKGNVIGFVMTTYRKLAASSLAAIATALRRRERRLLTGEQGPELEAEEDARFVEGDEFVSGEATQFFEGELAMLDDLAARAESLQDSDTKVTYFLEHVVQPILHQNPSEKLLVFTEYRGTQDHLTRALTDRYGPDKVSVIRGGQTFEERRTAIQHFESRGSFLVSTEAGGEGLNLHRQCHILVNFDLPWNPMRLVQRVGRLYRYGQARRVVVFNVHVPDTLDSEVLQRMYDRLESVAAEMAGVSDEYKEGLKEDILGELVGNLDVAEILEAARTDGINRSEERMEEALRKARDAAERQEEILSHASGYDPDELKNELKLDTEHLISFAEGMCELAGVEIANRLFGGMVWDIRLSEALQTRLTAKQNQRIAFTRETAERAADAAMFAPEHFLYEYFLDLAKDYRRNGHVAASSNLGGVVGFGAMLRWMSNEGRPTYREYVGMMMNPDSTVEVNSERWAEFLSTPTSGRQIQPPPSREQWGRLWEQLEQELKRRIEDDVQPDQPYPLGLIWKG